MTHGILRKGALSKVKRPKPSTLPNTHRSSDTYAAAFKFKFSLGVKADRAGTNLSQLLTLNSPLPQPRFSAPSSWDHMQHIRLNLACAELLRTFVHLCLCIVRSDGRQQN